MNFSFLVIHYFYISNLRIKLNRNIKGYKIYGLEEREIKLTAYADDITSINPYACSLTAPFEGNGDDIFDFKDRFMSKTEGLRFSQQDQAALIRSYLIGSAKNVYNKLADIQKADITIVFNQLIEKFSLSEPIPQFEVQHRRRCAQFLLKLECPLTRALHGINEDNRSKLLKNKFFKEMPGALKSQLRMHLDDGWDAFVSKALDLADIECCRCVKRVITNQNVNQGVTISSKIGTIALILTVTMKVKTNITHSHNQNEPPQYNKPSNDFSPQYQKNYTRNHYRGQNIQFNQNTGFDIKTFSRGASDSASFNFISLNPVSVRNDDWFINKAHPLMKVSSNIKLFSSHIETQMDLLVDNSTRNSLLKFSSLPTHFKNYNTVIDNSNDILLIINKNTNTSISTNSCEVPNTGETYFIQSNSISKSCYLSSKHKFPKDSESLLEVKSGDLNEFNSGKEVLFEPVKIESLILAHRVSKIED
ncbi:unnamed protein product [Brachionus calyciflorus]|uniref:Uncharacterized protein n=1 Tax=Brachionus calyciflorus TaxID=104777 RepID=A0A813ZYW6_9BILA|nr:unnamed protein product [Brachionus calyciflorus]